MIKQKAFVVIGLILEIFQDDPVSINPRIGRG